MAPTGGIEIERKFDANESTPWPPLEGLPGVSRIEAPVEYELDAVYFDTARLDLASRQVTLRRRTGGTDAGWHLKVPVGPDAREEVHAPLGTDPEAVPEDLLRQVRVFVRDQPLQAVMRLRNRRIVHRLLGGDGSVLAEVTDDHVRADRLGVATEQMHWREWELELVTGGRALLDAAQALLDSVGVHPSPHASKLARALGLPPPEAPRPRLGRTSSAGDVLLAALRAHTAELARQDPRVRHNAANSVHKMRIETRRLSAALVTYRKLLSPLPVVALRAELRWFARVLGAARDQEVLRDRMHTLLAQEPAGLVLGPVAERLGAHVGTDVRSALADVQAALDSDRYFRLLEALDRLLAAPGLTEAAARPARKVVPALLEKDVERLHTAARAAVSAPAGIDRDRALHEARKKAKRLRYAAETTVVVNRKRARRLATAAKKLQAILGNHQDSVVARDLLLRLGGVEAYLNGENAFTYGRLHALEQARATDADVRFRRAWKSFPHAR